MSVKHVGSGHYDVFKYKKDDFGWVWGVIAVFTVLGLLSQCG